MPASCSREGPANAIAFSSDLEHLDTTAASSDVEALDVANVQPGFRCSLGAVALEYLFRAARGTFALSAVTGMKD